MFGMGGTEILVILVVALLFLGPDKLPEAAKKISQGIRDIKKQTRVLQRTIEDDEHIGGAIRDLKSALRGDDEPIRPAKARAIEAAASVVALPEPPAEPPSLLSASVHDAVTAPNGVTAYDAAADDAVAAHAAANGAASPYAAAAAASPYAVTAATAASTAPAVAAASSPYAATAASTVAAASTAPAVAAASTAPVVGAGSTAGAAGPLAPPALTMSPTAGEPDDDAPRATTADDAVLAALVRPAPNTIARAPRSIPRPTPSSARPAPSATRPGLIAPRPAPIAKPAPVADEPVAPSDPSEPEHG